MGEFRHLLGILLELEFVLFGLLASRRYTTKVDPAPENDASGATSGFHSFSFLYLQIHCCHGGLAASKHGGGRHASPRCLFICTIISSCTKEQRQDIWCNTIAGSVPRGAPVCCVQSDRRTSSVQVAGPELLLPVTREPQHRITAAFLDGQCCRVIYY